MKNFNFENPADREQFMDYKKTNPEEAQEIINQEHNKAVAYELLHQYDNISLEYALATITDPNKRFVQYPEALRLLGSLEGKSVFDIGCANGTFTQMIKKAGAAELVGFEPSANELEKAKSAEKENPRGIEYIGDYAEIPVDKKFDVVSAIMVIPAINQEQMEEIFAKAGGLLVEGGKFVALTLNHDFQRFGEIVNNRKFSKRPDGRIDIDFYNAEGEVYMSIIDTDFTQEEVEQAAQKAGFGEVAWEKLKIDPAGIAELGAEFWNGYEEDCPYIGLTAQKK